MRVNMAANILVQSSRPQWTCPGAAEATGGTAGMGLCKQCPCCQQTLQLEPKSGSGCSSHRRAKGPPWSYQWSSQWSCWEVHVWAHLQPLFRPRQQGRRSHVAAQSLRAPSTCRHLEAWESAWTDRRTELTALPSSSCGPSTNGVRTPRPSNGGDLLLCSRSVIIQYRGTKKTGGSQPHGAQTDLNSYLSQCVHIFLALLRDNPLQAMSVKPSVSGGRPHLGRKPCNQRLPFTSNKRVHLGLSTSVGQPGRRQCTYTAKASGREHQCGAPALLRLLALAWVPQTLVVLPACTT